MTFIPFENPHVGTFMLEGDLPPRHSIFMACFLVTTTSNKIMTVSDVALYYDDTYLLWEEKECVEVRYQQQHHYLS